MIAAPRDDGSGPRPVRRGILLPLHHPVPRITASEPVNWLGTPASAFFSVVLADVWKTAPFVAIILLAGLQTIPKQIYEQARVDRANFVQIFFLVTLPLLRPVIVVALIFRTVDALRVFDLIYVLTAGGPGGATTPVSLYAYRYYLSGDYGSGSAVSILLFLVALGFSLICSWSAWPAARTSSPPGPPSNSPW